MPVLSGCTVEKIIYTNPENLYTIARLAHGPNNITAVFYDRAREGEKLNLTGTWVTHKKYGKQFKADNLERSSELTEDDISAILQNVKGIGPARAELLISNFGLKTLEIAKTNPESFKGLGIPENVIENIKLEFAENETISKLKETLLPLGLTINLIQKIYKQYQDKALDILRRNPYKLADDIKGIGYKKADDVALKLGMDPRDELRVIACTEYVLKKQASFGNVYLTKQELLLEVLKEMRQPIPTVKILQSIRNNFNLIEQGDRVYLKYLYQYELMIAKKLTRLSASAPLTVKNIDNIIELIEVQNSINYTPIQKKAIKKCFKHGVSIITGGPGTGKTTITKAIIEIALSQNKTVQLAAPTGKAAKRMEEVTGHPAKTIHRLLEYKPNGQDETYKMEFTRNELNPIDADLIIIDEASMIDTVLMYHLISAVKSTIVFIGDQNQLPSIGPGTVLADMIATLPATKLDVIFRQKETSAIITNSSRINKGLYPFFNDTDFEFHEYDSPDQILKIFKKELATDNEVQILTPVKRSESGTINLNKIIQESINPKHPNKPQIVFGDKTFRVGDRVMQQKNNYDKDIYNGDSGVVTKIYKDEDGIHTVIDFFGREVEFIDDEVKSLTLAYAITIHKSQGSQFDTVIIPLTTSHYIMLKRNLIYTAVTRAKKKVIIIGQKKAIAIAIKTLDSSKRNTSLGELLAEK